MCISRYGVNPDGPVPDLETDNIVTVPESTIQVTDNHTDEIRGLFPNPLNDDENHGIAHYLTIANYLKIRYRCSQNFIILFAVAGRLRTVGAKYECFIKLSVITKRVLPITLITAFLL